MHSFVTSLQILLLCVIWASAVSAQTSPPTATNLVITPETPFGAYGQPMNLRITNLVDPQVFTRFDTPQVTVSAMDENGRFATICLVTMRTVGNCTVPGRFHRRDTAIYRAKYDGNIFNLPADVFFYLTVDQERATIRLSNPTMPFVSGRTVTLSAFVRARALAGAVTFMDGEAPIPGCIGTPVIAVNTATSVGNNVVDAGIVECQFTVPPTSVARPGTYTARYSYPETTSNVSAGRITETSTVTVDLMTKGPEDYTDLWWAGMNENGWGMVMSTHGDRLVTMLYTYDARGESAWYIMPGGRWDASYQSITGDLLRPWAYIRSADFSTQIRLDAPPVGTISILFKNKTSATINYTINGTSGSKNIERQVFGTTSAVPTLRLADMWWYGSRENGYGFSLAQQGEKIVPIDYTYRSMSGLNQRGESIFVIAPNGTWSGTSWVGESYTTRSSPWLDATYNPAQFVATKTGKTFAIDFEDLDRASVQYTIGSIGTFWKPAMRLPF